MPNAIVHIGLHKTGTTSIQAWLGINRDVLGQRGFACDDFQSNAGRIDHTPFVAAIASETTEFSLPRHLVTKFGLDATPDRRQRKTSGFEASLAARLNAGDAKTYLVSTETFSTACTTVKAIAAVHAWFRARFEEVRYLVYLRRQDSFLESQFFQLVKAGLQDGLEDYARANAAIDYNAKLGRWAQVVGKDRLTVRLYSSETLKDGNVLADFADEIGTGLEQTTIPPRTNAASSPRAARILAWSYRQPWLSFLSRARRVQIARLLGGGEKIRLPETLRQEVLDRNSASNEQLRRNFFHNRSEEFDRWLAA